MPVFPACLIALRKEFTICEYQKSCAIRRPATGAVETKKAALRAAFLAKTSVERLATPPSPREVS